MADQDKPTGEDKPTNAERPLWSLSRDEQRLLMITFVGGLGSIVAGAGMIGVAIVLARDQLRRQSLASFNVGNLVFAVLTAAAIFAFRSKHVPPAIGELLFNPGARRWTYAALVVFWLQACLVWIGIAVGIK
jgi:hypothetical protein